MLNPIAFVEINAIDLNNRDSPEDRLSVTSDDIIIPILGRIEIELQSEEL
jgi:hypothetical protein